ncbi:MAG TPA: thioesterase domain-containing protein, partial [Bryobacteraceae bacterium]
HDVGGSVAGLFPIARRMAYSGAVIGIQARGLASQEPPHATVEAMAAEYLKEVKLWQPHGPYYLCGYSFGGLVAFEMARRLMLAGENVGLVGLFDTTMSQRRWPFRHWLSTVRRRMAHFSAAAGAAPVHRWPAVAWRILKGICEELRSYSSPELPDGQPLPGFLKCAPRRVLKVGVSALIASARYRPGFYPGELTLFTAVEHEHGRPPLDAIWSKHARTLRIVETAGTHSTMLSAPNAPSVASSLTRLLPVMTPAP